MATRRGFLLALGGSALLARSAGGQGQEPLAGQGSAGTLRDPGAAGRPQGLRTGRENDPFITAVEHRIQCTCGCTLDVYTCRTTDFTCTYSPGMHREVVALADEGKTADEIVAAFVAKYGEKVLMAPKPVGFNIAGYVVPGVLILMVAVVIVVVLRRRMRVTTEVAATGTSGAATVLPAASAEELARLRTELEKSER